ncbi:LytTR family transcriptional regulator DNA-binding domain-containing protein [Paenibacillus sp. sptzw28]|uniref:LytTR family transcriptional regulator DNA-binding domain-containing protein n=1 Tax=Paenibacillus sp. sptzw28 TaxID=715179 RepID=UPI001C6EFCF0|nr:LytTR family transcriptional regulator DNA-binding domain-containing protein [Paenibacillus sp. sptzw28]QYR22679.1 LytTR family transcriptional regulator DNA-binding domain-containing protein [Paenibacillus sp. sptzw28]
MEHKHIPVLRSDKSIYWLNIEDICYSSMDGKRIAFHTKTETFYQINNFDELLRLLTPDAGFEKLDRSVVVKMDNVTYFDSDYGVVYFDKTVEKRSKFATVATGYIQKVKKLIGLTKNASNNL